MGGGERESTIVQIPIELDGVDNVSTTGGVVADVVVGDERVVLPVVFPNPRFGIALSRIIL